MQNVKKKSHAVYMCTYHMVFVTKYSKKVITNEIGDMLKKRATEVCPLFDSRLEADETDQDYIRLLVELQPQVSPAEAIRVLKTQLAKAVHQNPVYDKQAKQTLYVMCSGHHRTLCLQPALL